MDRRSDNTFPGARSLQFDRTIRDAVGQRDRIDIYQFRASSQVSFSLSLSGLRGNVNVKLLNERRGTIAASNQPRSRPEQIGATLENGTYYVQVQYVDRRGATPYSLRASATPMPSPNPSPSPSPSPSPIPSPTPTPVPVGDGSIATSFDIGVLSQTYVKQEVVGPEDPVDFFKFTLSDTANLEVRVQEFSGSGRFELIRDDNNNGLVDNGEVYASSFSNLPPMDMPPGTYFLKVSSTVSTGYQLSFVPTLFGGNLSPEPGNTLPLAADLGIYSGTRSIREYAGVFDVNDLYRFTLNDLSNLQVTVTGSSTPAQIDLIRDDNNNGLIDSGETYVSREGSGTTTPARLNQDLPVGAYFLNIKPRFGGNSSTSYEMALVGTPYGGNGSPDPGNTLPAARNLGVLSGTSSLKEYVGVLDPSDFYRFTLSNPGSFQARLAASSDVQLDIDLIQDANNNGLIDNNELFASGTNSLTRSLQAGTYFFRIESRFTGSFSTNYQLDLITP